MPPRDAALARPWEGPPGAEPGVAVGVDLTSIAEVADALARLGPRYLRRLFTDQEVRSCGGHAEPRAESLAARFAAKEAALKVLRPAGCRPPWRDIEVRRNDDGSCDLHLHGAAAALASRRGVQQLALSMSHEAGMAVAVVIGTLRRPVPVEPGGTTPSPPGDRHQEGA